MADDFEEFAQRILRQVEETKRLHLSRSRVDQQISETKEKLRTLEAEREDINQKLVGANNQQKALMGGYALPVTDSIESSVSRPHCTTIATPSSTGSFGVTERATTDETFFATQSAVSSAAPNVRPVIVDLPSEEETIHITPRSRSDLTPANEKSIHTTDSPSPLGYKYSLVYNIDDPAKDLWYRCRTSNRDGLIHPDYPTVLLLNGQWTDIACGLCGANAHISQASVRYYKGIVSLYNHMKASHAEVDAKSIDVTLKTCSKRLVSELDVIRLSKGEAPESPIEKCIRKPSAKVTTKLAEASTPPPDNFNGIVSPSRSSSATTSLNRPATSLADRPKKRQTEYDSFQSIEATSAANPTQPYKRRKKAPTTFGYNKYAGLKGYGNGQIYDDEDDEEYGSNTPDFLSGRRH